MKNSIIITRASCTQLTFLLFFSTVTFHLPTLATAQSLVSNDVKHDSPGQPIKRDQAVQP